MRPSSKTVIRAYAGSPWGHFDWTSGEKSTARRLQESARESRAARIRAAVCRSDAELKIHPGSDPLNALRRMGDQPL